MKSKFDKWSNNSTNINKTNNDISPKIIEHRRPTYEVGNTGPLLGQGQTYGGFKLVNGIKILPLENFSNAI